MIKKQLTTKNHRFFSQDRKKKNNNFQIQSICSSRQTLHNVQTATACHVTESNTGLCIAIYLLTPLLLSKRFNFQTLYVHQLLYLLLLERFTLLFYPVLLLVLPSREIVQQHLGFYLFKQHRIWTAFQQVFAFIGVREMLLFRSINLLSVS